MEFVDLLYQASSKDWFLGIDLALLSIGGSQVFTSASIYSDSGTLYETTAVQMRLQVNGTDIYSASMLPVYCTYPATYGATAETYSFYGSIIINFDEFWTP